eukprot:scaffold296811_cov18-Tisochrysis_lutea.AAC.1
MSAFAEGCDTGAKTNMVPFNVHPIHCGVETSEGIIMQSILPQRAEVEDLLNLKACVRPRPFYLIGTIQALKCSWRCKYVQHALSKAPTVRAETKKSPTGALEAS